jgi:hypothetical protein
LSGLMVQAAPNAADIFKSECFRVATGSAAHFTVEVLPLFNPNVSQKALPYVNNFTEIHEKLLRLQCEQLALLFPVATK